MQRPDREGWSLVPTCEPDLSAVHRSLELQRLPWVFSHAGSTKDLEDTGHPGKVSVDRIGIDT